MLVAKMGKHLKTLPLMTMVSKDLKTLPLMTTVSKDPKTFPPKRKLLSKLVRKKTKTKSKVWAAPLRKRSTNNSLLC